MTSLVQRLNRVSEFILRLIASSHSNWMPLFQLSKIQSLRGFNAEDQH